MLVRKSFSIRLRRMATRSAGLVVARREADQAVQFLLLRASKPPHHWSPPKGHVDPGETDLEAAIRETDEETGIKREQLTIHEDCQHTLRYKITESVAHPEDIGKEKTAVYWLASLNNSEKTCDVSNEHCEMKWADVDEACRLAHFAGMDAMWRAFDAFFTNKKN